MARIGRVQETFGRMWTIFAQNVRVQEGCRNVYNTSCTIVRLLRRMGVPGMERSQVTRLDHEKQSDV